MADKFGSFITKLMTTIVDKEQDEFVKNLAWSELSRLNTNIEDFLRVNSEKQKQDNEEKQLLQEEKKDDRK